MSNKTADEYVAIANVQIKIGCYERALRLLNKAVELNSSHPKALRRKGKVLRELKRYDEAIPILINAYQIEKKARTCVEIGDCLLRTQKYDEALEWVKKSFDIDPEYAWGWEREGRILRALKLYDRAISVLQHLLNKNSIDKKTRAWAFSELGESYRLKGCNDKDLREKYYREALKKQNKALEINPKLWRAFERKGRILRLLKDYTGAIDAQNESLKINKHNVAALLEKAECNRKIGNNHRAFEMQKKAYSKDPKLSKLWKNRTCDRS